MNENTFQKLQKLRNIDYSQIEPISIFKLDVLYKNDTLPNVFIRNSKPLTISIQLHIIPLSTH